MPHVAVTGGSGRLGPAVVRELVEHGYEVVNLDANPPAQPVGRYIRIDLTDYGQVVGALTGIEGVHGGLDAVVHLAAIPSSGIVTNAATFHNNSRATYNIFEAARVAGITNVVWASSETVLGLPFDTPPPYLPVDEEYTGRPESTYALNKLLEEHLALHFCRWNPALKAIGLRFSNVMLPADYVRFPAFDADPLARKWNLWGYIDARDGAQAVRKALEYEATGMDVFVIANADTVMSRSSRELAAEVFPGVPVRKELVGNETLLSIDKARRLLGYEPEHSWRDEIHG
jgi:nucleoside-diphosphate-sugar epimerase